MISDCPVNNYKLIKHPETNTKVNNFYKIEIPLFKNHNERQECLFSNKKKTIRNFHYLDENMQQNVSIIKSQRISLRKKRNKCSSVNIKNIEDYQTENIIIFNNDTFWNNYRITKSKIKHYKALSQSIKKNAMKKKKNHISSQNRKINAYHKNTKLIKDNINTSNYFSMKKIANHCSPKTNKIIKICGVFNDNYYNNNYYTLIPKNQIISDAEVGQKRHGQKTAAVSIMNTSPEKNISPSTSIKSINSNKNCEKPKINYNLNVKNRNSVINKINIKRESSKSKKRKNKGKKIPRSPVKIKIKRYLSVMRKFSPLNSTLNQNIDKNKKFGIIGYNKKFNVVSKNLGNCRNDNYNCLVINIEKNNNASSIYKKGFKIFDLKSQDNCNKKRILLSNTKNKMNLKTINKNFNSIIAQNKINYELSKNNSPLKHNKKVTKCNRKKVKENLINKK